MCCKCSKFFGTCNRLTYPHLTLEKMLCGYHEVYGTCHRFQCAILLFLNLIGLDVMRWHLRMEADVNWDVCQVDGMKGMRASIHQFKGLTTLANQFINIYQKQIERERGQQRERGDVRGLHLTDMRHQALNHYAVVPHTMHNAQVETVPCPVLSAVVLCGGLCHFLRPKNMPQQANL